MAGLSDRAKLIAELILLDKLSGPARTATGSLGKLDSATSKVGKSMGFVGHTISTALGVGLSRAVGAGIGLVESSISGAIEQTKLLESAQAQTNAVLKSTKGVSGQTADGIRTMAEQFENVSALIDDKVIQSGENMLLTFTNIGPKAFKPATQAILDMNTAMGSGPEGLTKTAILVGKALNDPIKGATALRRVGVTLTKQQQDQIKTLVKQNDLYGAQQIILKELGTEFGGSFAAQGQTAAGAMAAFHDSIEDLQLSLGTALMPALKNVAGALATTFKDPALVTGVSNLGKSISDFLTPEHIQQGIGLVKDAFKGIVGFAKQVPWEAIGTALQIGGAGARTIMGAFASAPPWLQTAIITGWGLNKLTGGLGSSLFGSLASGLIKGVLGMNAGVVNINAGVVNGLGGAEGGLLNKLPLIAGGGALAVALTAGTIAALGIAFVASQQVPRDPFLEPGGHIAPGRGFGAPSQHGRAVVDENTGALKDNTAALKGVTKGQLHGAPGGGHPAAAQVKLNDAALIAALAKTSEFGFKGIGTAIEHGIAAGTDPFGKQALALFQRAEFPRQGKTLGEIERHIIAAQDAQKQFAAKGDRNAVAQLQATIDGLRALLSGTNKVYTITQAEAVNRASTANRLNRLLDPLPGGIAALNAKDFSPTIKVTIPITNKVSISTGNVVRTLTSYTAAFGSGQGGAVPNPY